MFLFSLYTGQAKGDLISWPPSHGAKDLSGKTQSLPSTRRSAPVIHRLHNVTLSASLLSSRSRDDSLPSLYRLISSPGGFMVGNNRRQLHTRITPSIGSVTRLHENRHLHRGLETIVGSPYRTLASTVDWQGIRSATLHGRDISGKRGNRKHMVDCQAVSLVLCYSADYLFLLFIMHCDWLQDGPNYAL